MHSKTGGGGLALRPTFSGILLGMRLTLPILPGLAVVAAVFGTLSAQKGLTLLEAVMTSVFVFAGAAQLSSLTIWTEPLTLASILTMAVVTAMINMRLVLIGASLRPWLGGLPPWQSYPILGVTTDSGWLIAMAYHREGGLDTGVLLGTGIIQWLIWWPVTAIGFAFGSSLSDPARFGFDMVFPVFFASMLVPQWRGLRHTIPWIVSGVVALAAERAFGGWWFIVAGSVSGMIVGGFIDDDA